MLLVWDENAWEDYLWWQAQDRKVLNRISAVLVDIQRNGYEGIGEPNELEQALAGYTTRRTSLRPERILRSTAAQRAPRHVRTFGAAHAGTAANYPDAPGDRRWLWFVDGPDRR